VTDDSIFILYQKFWYSDGTQCFSFVPKILVHSGNIVISYCTKNFGTVREHSAFVSYQKFWYSEGTPYFHFVPKILVHEENTVQSRSNQNITIQVNRTKTNITFLFCRKTKTLLWSKHSMYQLTV